MSDWGFVFAGWIVTYVAIGIWVYFSRSKKVEK